MCCISYQHLFQPCQCALLFHSLCRAHVNGVSAARIAPDQSPWHAVHVVSTGCTVHAWLSSCRSCWRGLVKLLQLLWHHALHPNEYSLLGLHCNQQRCWPSNTNCCAVYIKCCLPAIARVCTAAATSVIGAILWLFSTLWLNHHAGHDMATSHCDHGDLPVCWQLLHLVIRHQHRGKSFSSSCVLPLQISCCGTQHPAPSVVQLGLQPLQRLHARQVWMEALSSLSATIAAAVLCLQHHFGAVFVVCRSCDAQACQCVHDNLQVYTCKT